MHSPTYGDIKFNEPISDHTTIKAGGAARIWINPQNIKQLLTIIKDARQLGIKYVIFGSGSNIIFSDKGFDGFIIQLSAPDFNFITKHKQTLKIGCGVKIKTLLDYAVANSLSGCEFLAGIPGTIGAAIAVNAGAQNSSISDIVKTATFIDKDLSVKTKKRKNINFGYRKSPLNSKIILSAELLLKKSKAGRIKAKIKENISKKLKNQDYSAPSSGCIFKNPENSEYTAGMLIDASALKGKRIGGAVVSEKHANFIINEKNAKAKDIFLLIDYIKKTVLKKHKILLHEEVRIVK